LALVACGGNNGTGKAPAPLVTNMTPAMGAWGTEITIQGANFGAVAAAGYQVAFDGAVGTNGFVIDTWHDTQIQGRIAFPATGSMVVRTPAGEADAGDFTTTMTYAPSPAVDVSALVDGIVLSTGEVAGFYHEYELANQAAIAVFGGSGQSYLLGEVVDQNDKYGLIYGKIVEADDHTALVIATKQDHSVAAFGTSGGHLQTTATGLNGNVLAAGRDATGLYAWIDTDSGLVRARPGTTSWTTDAGPMQISAKAIDGAIAADGTLWVVQSQPSAGQTAYVALQTLAPGGSQLSAIAHADGTAYANEISRAHLTIAADGTHAVISGTADAGGTPVDFTSALAGGTWTAAPALPGVVQYTFFGSTLGAIVNDAQAKTTSLVPDATNAAGAQVIPVWPMMSANVVVDGAGKAHPLLTNGNVTYALTPPQ
jgi:hypothetical protein